MTVQLIDHKNDNSKDFDTRAEAEDKKQELLNSPLDYEDDDLEIKLNGKGESEPDEPVQATPVPDEQKEDLDVQKAHEQAEDAIQQLGESIENDPLDVLPSYMITHVDGEPSLNKRGVSVLAYHYDIDVVDHEAIAYPHETDYKSAIVEITVEGPDGRTFVGSGEAHTDEMEAHKLLRMAETRAYKRAVIFATGTGIVGYMEIVNEL